MTSGRRYLLVHTIVEAAHSFVPVLWQGACPESQALDFSADDSREFLDEVEAALTAVPATTSADLPVILCPRLAANFVHETLGHTSEADNYLSFRRETGMDLGDRWCDYPLSVLDDPTLPGYCGGYVHDAEGIAARRQVLIESGIWRNVLTNTAHAGIGCRVGGNGRRTAGHTSTLPRMSITWAAAGSQTVDELVGSVENGLYCVGSWGGINTPAAFIIRPAYAWRIQDGNLTAERLRRFDIAGDKRDAVAAIAGMSSDVKFYDTYAGCDKSGHDGLTVTNGAPHILLGSAHIRPI
jgi:TldD protein